MMKTLAYYFLVLFLGFWGTELYRAFFQTSETPLIDAHLSYLRWWKCHYPFDLSLKHLKSLPKYRFYTDLMNRLLNLQRTYGKSPENSFGDLRKALMKQRNFHLKYLSINRTAFLQFFVMGLLVWIMVILSSYSLAWKPPTGLIIIIVVLQTMGLLLYRWLSKVVDHRLFKSYNAMLYQSTQFLCLYQSGLPYQKVLEMSQITKVPFEKELKSELDSMLNRWQKHGQRIEEDIQELIDQIWAALYLTFEQFLQFMALLRLFTLVFFFLSSYFCYLAYLMNSLI